MQLRVKAMYGKIMSRLITVFWILEALAVVALGVASLAAIDGKMVDFYQNRCNNRLLILSSGSVHARRNSNV